MNIFILDYDIKTNVSYYNDKHVVKMILESTQILSTVNRRKGYNEGYKITHINHPCVIWTSESLENYFYVKELAYALIEEWRYRFHGGLKTPNKCEQILNDLTVPLFMNYAITKPPQCMPDYCKK